MAQSLDFLLHAGVDTVKLGGTTGQYDDAVQVLADPGVDIALHDRWSRWRSAPAASLPMKEVTIMDRRNPA